jgi:hypothetical protein
MYLALTKSKYIMSGKALSMAECHAVIIGKAALNYISIAGLPQLRIKMGSSACFK